MRMPEDAYEAKYCTKLKNKIGGQGFHKNSLF